MFGRSPTASAPTASPAPARRRRRGSRSGAAFAAASVQLLFALGALQLLQHGTFTVEDQIELCRLYSAEVEYSDDNLNALFDALM